MIHHEIHICCASFSCSTPLHKDCSNLTQTQTQTQTCIGFRWRSFGEIFIAFGPLAERLSLETTVQRSNVVPISRASMRLSVKRSQRNLNKSWSVHKVARPCIHIHTYIYCIMLVLLKERTRFTRSRDVGFVLVHLVPSNLPFS